MAAFRAMADEYLSWFWERCSESNSTTLAPAFHDESSKFGGLKSKEVYLSGVSRLGSGCFAQAVD